MPMKKYKHLNYDQRCQVAVLIKDGYSQTKIANILNVNQSTISREIKRNKATKGKYRHKQAHDIATSRRQRFLNTTVSNKHEKLIKQLLKKKYSPEQISGYLKRTENILISYTPRRCQN